MLMALHYLPSPRRLSRAAAKLHANLLGLRKQARPTDRTAFRVPFSKTKNSVLSRANTGKHVESAFMCTRRDVCVLVSGQKKYVWARC